MSTTLPTVDQEKTGLGNYFIANYPPFAFWHADALPDADAALRAPPRPETPLGLYLHIPFCRKRCKFCYFRVYTDKNAREVEEYLAGLFRELELYQQCEAVRDRSLDFIYFGGGTPSYLSAGQLQELFSGIRARLRWDRPREVTFECEPGTLQQPKLVALKEMGVTRLSLGVEHFDDEVLDINGRAHRSPEIFRAYSWARDLGFDQINLDLIAGMVGETWEKWRRTVAQTLDLAPESVTIYQMELPFNTVISKELRDHGQSVAADIADWPTKRAWVDYAFDQFLAAGYAISSGYTLIRDRSKTSFVYRDALWHGADLLGTGVASFGHVNGVHMQNLDQWDRYLAELSAGRLPLARALTLTSEEALIREMVLQLKTGRLESAYFQGKFGVDPLEHFAAPFADLLQRDLAKRQNGTLELTRAGLVQVDRLLPAFFRPEHRGPRYA
jgi:oxygen-independent coproporphyrinogen-3 oxidase